MKTQCFVNQTDSCRSAMTPLVKGTSKLEELLFDFQAKAQISQDPDQVLQIKEKELSEKVQQLRLSEQKCKVSLAGVKFYLKGVSQNKQVDLEKSVRGFIN